MSFFLALGAAVASQSPDVTTPVESEVALGPARGVVTYVEGEAGVGYGTNPLLVLGDDTEQAYGRLSLRGVHTRRSERSTTVLSGYGENIFYTRRFKAQQLLQLNGHHDTAVSETLRLFGDVDVSLDRGGQLGTRLVGIPTAPDPTTGPLPTPPIPGGDFVVGGGRNFRFGTQVGAQLALSELDSMTLTAGYNRAAFRSDTFDSDLRSLFSSASYDRQLSERATIGGRISTENTNYDGPGRVRLITPQLTGQLLLGERFFANGAIGVSFTEVDDGIDKRSSTGLALNGSLCRTGEDDVLCARVSRAQQTATNLGAGKSLTGGVDYSRRLDANQTIDLSASAARYSNRSEPFPGAVPFTRSTYYGVAGAYTRKIGHRLGAGVNVSARNLSQSGPDPKADINGSLYVRYRLGDVE